jgi:hypothetical protein
MAAWLQASPICEAAAAEARAMLAHELFVKQEWLTSGKSAQHVPGMTR